MPHEWPHSDGHSCIPTQIGADKLPGPVHPTQQQQQSQTQSPSEMPPSHGSNGRETRGPVCAAVDKENVRHAVASKLLVPSAEVVHESSKPSVPKHIYDGTAKTFYTLGRFLGKGGFASCYQVSSEATGKQYAVKIVPKASLLKPKQKNKLLQEIKIHQTLRHDHIVRLYRVFEDEHFVYIVMELCESQTVMEQLKQSGRLTDQEARLLLLQLLAAVEYLHDNRVIHRDLKLGNLFLKPGPVIKLGDFGLATLVYGENDRKRTICGTPNYIAPEIIAGGEKGHSYEVDIWSFGVIMYTLLVGQPPFQRQEVKEIYEKIKVANFDFPAQVAVSLAAKDLINRLLHPNPEQRPKIPEIRSHPYFAAPTAVTSVPPVPQSPSRRELVPMGSAAATESGLILSIQQSIRTLLANYVSSTSTIEKVDAPETVYLVKWMDFSSKYGIGYLLSDRSSGFYFNDGTSLILSPDRSRGHYFQPDGGNRRLLVRESFCAGQPRAAVQAKLDIVQKFEGFLHAGEGMEAKPRLSGDGSSMVFVVKYFRTSQATFFRLSHRVLQVNFFDHSKLIFGEEGRMITFVDQDKRSIRFPQTISRVQLSSTITRKLQYVSDLFASMMT